MSDETAGTKEAETELVFKPSRVKVVLFRALMVLACAGLIARHVLSHRGLVDILFDVMGLLLLGFSLLGSWGYEVRLSESALIIRSLWRERIYQAGHLRGMNLNWKGFVVISYADNGRTRRASFGYRMMSPDDRERLLNALPEFYPGVPIE